MPTAKTAPAQIRLLVPRLVETPIEDPSIITCPNAKIDSLRMYVTFNHRFCGGTKMESRFPGTQITDSDESAFRATLRLARILRQPQPPPDLHPGIFLARHGCTVQ